MSDEVRRAVVERVKSPLSINLSFLYPDAAIHFLKCPSHSVIASFVRRARLDAEDGATARPCAGATNVRDPLGGSSPSWRVVRGQSARDPLAPRRVSSGRSQHAARRRGPLARRRLDDEVSPTPRRVAWSGAKLGACTRSTQDDPGFRSAVHRPAARRARAPRDGQSRRPRPTTARAGPGRRPRARRVLPPDEADRRRINPASTRSRPVARERDAWTTMHRRRQSDIQIAHQHVTIQHDHRKISDFCPRGRTTRLSLCADHPFIRHVCLSPATWLSPACPERTPSF